MANTSLNWEFRHVLHHFRADGTLSVYICYLLHANLRNRSWPSIELLIKETGWSRASVVGAKKWLVDHAALQKVGMMQRIGTEEQSLHQRVDIMQVTGIVIIDGEAIPVLYFNQQTNEYLNNSASESMDTKSMVAEHEVVTTPKVITINKGERVPNKNRVRHKTSVLDRYKGW